MQRLFSNFANGWPGIGLLLLRFLTAAMLIYFGGVTVLTRHSVLMAALQIAGATAAVFLLLGFLTPIAGTLAALAKVWIAMMRFSSHSGDPFIAIAQAILALSLAMIGPGAWSIDALRFGRKHIDFPD